VELGSAAIPPPEILRIDQILCPTGGDREMGRLDGKVAVITGATSGIGLRTAEVFAAEGAKIVIAGRRVAEGEALAKQLGPACIFRQTDVTVEDQMRALIALAVEKFGKIDCLFNNAGGPAQTGGIESPFSPVIASEAKQSIYPGATSWIASSLRSLAQTLRVCRRQ
jgi:NAD(P)-dependent dehydrogenase (short-subunit alcohol dehydrogenase family)